MDFVKNQIVTIKIEDIGTNGEGVGRVDGFTLFVKGAVIGDLVEAKIIKVKKHYGYARIEKILEPGKDRVKPVCPVADKCGGCAIQHLSYEKQLDFKQKKVENNRTELNMKAKMFEQEVVAFQQKLDNNGFVTRERAEQAQADLMVKRQNLQKLDQELMETTQREQIELNQKLFTEITNFLKEYNKTKGYQLILSTTVGGNVFYAEDGFDITKDVVNQLNQQYRNK